jgi:uncharacterized protein (TIGR00251 family)
LIHPAGLGRMRHTEKCVRHEGNYRRRFIVEMAKKKQDAEATDEQTDVASLITVRVSPKSQKGAVIGWMDDGALKVKVLSAPEGGRANIELLRVVAEELKIPVRHVTIESGSTSTTKTLKILGLDEDEVKRRLDR